MIRLMEQRPLGRTGLSVSVLGFGAAPIGYLQTDRDRTAAILGYLLDHGVNLIDTAASYKGSEELIGAAIANRRNEYVLVSKCGQKVSGEDGIDGVDWSPQLIAATVDRSLRRLRTDRLDVMLLHSCPLEVLERGEALGALVQAREAGKIRFAGYSGDNDAAAYAAALSDIAVIETSINVADQANLTRVLPAAKSNGVGVIAKRPIANAAWRAPERQPGMYKSYAEPYTARLKKMGLTPAALGIGGDPDAAWPELALRFTLSFPEVHTAIIGTTNPQNAQRNIDFAEKGALPADAVAKIRAAFRHADPTGAWDGLT